MLSIPETGNSTLIDWQDSNYQIEEGQVNFISDYFCGLHTFFGYQVADKRIIQVKTFSEFATSSIPQLDREWSKKEIVPAVLSDTSTGLQDSTKMSVANLLKSKLVHDFNNVLILSNEDKKYQVTAYKGTKLMYYNILETDRVEEVLYYVSAVVDTFLTQNCEIHIESSEERFKSLDLLFSKYYKNVKSINASVLAICQGLDSNLTIDVNCATLQYYLAD